MSDEELPPDVASWMAAVSHYWLRLGIIEPEREALLAELDHDMRESLAAGATSDELISVDAHDFARDLAEARGLAVGPAAPDEPMTMWRFVETAMLGAVAGALASAVVVYPIGIRLMDALATSDPAQGIFALGIHVVASLIAAGCAGAAVRWRFRFQRQATRAAVVASFSLLVAGAASVMPVMAATITGPTPVIPFIGGLPAAVDLIVVLAFLVAGLLAGYAVLTTMGRTAAAPAHDT